MKNNLNKIIYNSLFISFILIIIYFSFFNLYKNLFIKSFWKGFIFHFDIKYIELTISIVFIILLIKNKIFFLYFKIIFEFSKYFILLLIINLILFFSIKILIIYNSNYNYIFIKNFHLDKYIIISFFDSVFLSPLIEELFYRGFLYYAFSLNNINKNKKILLFIIFSLIITFFHLRKIDINPLINYYYLFIVFIYFFSGYLFFDKTKNILQLLILHIFINFISFLLCIS